MVACVNEEREPYRLGQDERDGWHALALLLNRLPAALDAQMQRDAGISRFEYMVMSALSTAPERTMRLTLLARHTGATPSRLSNVIGKLEERVWVRRSPDPSNGRTTLATLTDEGFAAVRDATPRHVAEIRRLVFDPLTGSQRHQLGVIATRMLRAIDPDAPVFRG